MSFRESKYGVVRINCSGDHFLGTIIRDDVTGVNYLLSYRMDKFKDKVTVGSCCPSCCPLFGFDGKPLVTDIEGNIREEQRFNQQAFEEDRAKI